MKHLIVFTIFYFAIFKANSQNLSIVYEAYSVGEPDAIKNAIPELSENDVKYYYSLTIDKGISKFSRDSVFVVSFASTGMTGIWYFEAIYKNYNKDLWIKSSGRYKPGYGLEKKLSQLKASNSNNYQWKISQDKQVIAGMECTKAVSQKGYTAWFAPKLPYPDGPMYGVFNLPGLVLSLETPYDKWIAKEILMGNKKVQIPNLELVENEMEINLSYNEIKNLSPEKVIILEKDTPTKKWITFKK